MPQNDEFDGESLRELHDLIKGIARGEVTLRAHAACREPGQGLVQ